MGRLWRDAEAVATAVMMSLVGCHLAEQFFGAPVGVDRVRFVNALASLVGSRAPPTTSEQWLSGEIAATAVMGRRARPRRATSSR